MGPFRGLNVYNRFTTLNAYNLLIQQAELLHLESQLEVFAVTDAAAGFEYDRNALSLIESGEKGRDDEQWRMVLRVREKLREYCVPENFVSGTWVHVRADIMTDDDLLRQSGVAQLPNPRRYDLCVLREWIGSRKGGDGFLSGHEALPWSLDEEQLVALSQRDHDTVTAYIMEHLTPWYTRLRDKVRALVHRIMWRTLACSHPSSQKAAPGHEEFGLVYCPDEPYERTARVMAVLASTLIPSLAIVILYFITSLIVRLVVAMLLSLLFSTAIALLTKARAVEIFASTAAFAAVQVVFIGSTSI